MKLFSLLSLSRLIPVLMLCVFASLPLHAEEFNQFKLDLMLAKRGDPGAQFYVATAYEEGRGVKKDLKQAFEWFSKAAKNKHNGAQFKLGEFYEHGWGVKKDQARAEAWYRTAEKNGSRLAGKRLAQIKAEKQAALKAKSSKEAAAARKKRLEQERKQRQARERRLAAEKARREKKAREAKARKVKAKAPVTVASVKPAVRSKPKAKKLSPAEKAALIGKHAKAVFSRKWYDAQGAASVLPSSLNNCLESSDNEIVCFSKEQRKIIAHSEVAFTSKSIMKDFKPNGDFILSYYFNVLDISDSPEAGVSQDPLGLRVEKGWQEPEQKMACSIKKQKIQCKKSGNSFIYHP